MSEYKDLLNEVVEKSIKAIALLGDSISELKPFDPKKEYTSKELEPYDAFTSRFERAIELLLSKCFRTYELHTDGVSEGSTRDLLNKMEKYDVISKSVDEWIGMRKLRNRIAHDYLPEQVSKMYDLIIAFYPEMKKAVGHLKKKT